MPPQSALRKWGPLAVLSLALAIVVIDTTLLNVALATIIRDLHTDIQHLQWVITAYALMLAAFTITGGRLGDFFGRKKMFVFGAIIFAVGSLLASYANSVGVLIFGEAIIEGIGAALMLPATSSLLVSIYKGRDRAKAFGVWGGIAGAAAAVGPILGGYLTTTFSWRWGFRINVFVALVLVIGSFLIKEVRETTEKPKLDYLGVVLSALGLLGITFGIIEASTYGWFFAKQVFMIGSHAVPVVFGLSILVPSVYLGLVFLLLFVLWEAHMELSGQTPLVSLLLFRNTEFSSGIVTTGVMSLGQSGLIFSIPVFFQAVRGLDAFHTGLGLLPLSIALLIGAPLSAFLIKFLYPKTLIMIGIGVNILSYVVLVFTLSVNATPWTIAPGLFLYGLGAGLVLAQISNITLSAVTVEKAGEASGVNNTIRQTGSTLGSAIMGSILIASIVSGFSSGVQKSTVIPAEYKPALLQSASSQLSTIEFGSGGASRGGTNANPYVRKELTSIGHDAVTAGAQRALVFAGIINLLAFFAASRLKKERTIRDADDAAKPLASAH